MVRAGGLSALSRSARAGKWRHPWTVTPEWRPDAEAWFATITPGFVGGRAPVVVTTAAEQAASGGDFGINPLSGEPYFSASVFDNPAKADVTREIHIPIYDRPAIRLNLRNLGFDGIDSEAVPKFFRDRGVQEQPGTASFAERIESGQSERDRKSGRRLLRAADMILHMPREALTSQAETAPGLLTGQGLVTQTLGVQPPVPGDVLKVFSGRHQPSPDVANQILGGGVDLFANLYAESPWDELRIATVYLLSQPDELTGSQPDNRWQPFVRHDLFWNLHYEPRRNEQIVIPESTIGYIPPLAGGIAQPIINFLTSTINDATDTALNIIKANSLQGTWWTPTGGGNHAIFPSEPEETPRGRFGGDKPGRLAAQSSAAAAKRRGERLDPDFPFRAVAFDPAQLSS